MSNKREAYLLFSFKEDGDMKAFAKYAQASNPILAKYGGELIVIGAKAATISRFEGEWPDDAGLTLIRFPSRENLEEFWNSAEYQEIVDMRTEVLPANFTIGFSNAWRGAVAGQQS